MNTEWFRKYMNNVAANIANKEGNMRFSYRELRTALNALEERHEEDVPENVLQLFANIMGVLPQIPLDEKQERVLFLALLNCHMAYFLISGFLLNEDDSIDNDKEELSGSNTPSVM